MRKQKVTGDEFLKDCSSVMGVDLYQDKVLSTFSLRVLHLLGRELILTMAFPIPQP